MSKKQKKEHMTQQQRVVQLYLQALHLYQQSGLDAGRAFHEQVRQLAPDSLYDEVLTGLAHAVGERFEEALAAYDRALKLGVDPHKVVFLLKSQALVKLARYDEAIAACDAGIALAPGNISLLEAKAVFLLEFHRLADATSVYEEILKMTPRAVELLLFKSLALFLLGNTQQAWSALQQVLVVLPNPSKLPAFKENMRAHLGQYEQLVDEHLATHQAQADAWFFKGMVVIMGRSPAGPFDEGVTAFEQAIRLDATCAWAWNGKGIVLMAQERYQEAAAAFARAAGLFPSVEGFARNRTNAVRAAEGAISKRRHRGGREQVKQHKGQRYAPLEIPPKELLEQLMDEEQFDEALVACDQLISVARKGLGGLNLVAALWTRARILLDLERPAEAIETYREVLRRDSTQVDARRELVETLFLEQRYDEALETSAGPLSSRERDEGSYVQNAALLLMQGRVKEALVSAERARALDPTNIVVYLIIVTTLQKLGQNSEALRVCDEALRVVNLESRSTPMLFLCKADTLLALGQPAEALAVYDEALRREMGHREQQLEDTTGALLEGILYDRFPGSAAAFIYGGIGNAWLLLENATRAIEYYDLALSLGPNEEIESNRTQALALLHRLTNLAPDYEPSISPGPFQTPSRRAERADAASSRAWVGIERAAFAVGALLVLLLLGGSLSGIALGPLLRTLPVWAEVAFDITIVLLYPVSCWFGWASPSYEEGADRNSRVHRFREAAFSGGGYLVLTGALLVTILALRGGSSTDWATWVTLELWIGLVLLHLLVWLALTRQKAVGGRARTNR